jgi:uncharacterized protein YqiB (DUF1249 family)
MYFLEPLAKSYWLSKLCEANYERLLRLIPDLTQMAGTCVAHADGKPSLHMQLQKNSRYTLTLELTHRFGLGLLKPQMEPSVRVRVYLDVRAAEMLGDHDRPKVYEAFRWGGKGREMLDYKWKLNYFLSQWLDHCLANDYCFSMTRCEQNICTEEV